MGDWFWGEIRLFPYNRIPAGWVPCDGGELMVSDPANKALFALIGYTYGGNGSTIFNVPDLRGRVPLSMNFSDPAYRNVGTKGGQESVVLGTDQVPPHRHTVAASNAEGTAILGQDRFPAVVGKAQSALAPPPPPLYAETLSQAVAFDPTTIGNTGGGFGHENRQPSIALVYCIANSGNWPQRQ